MSGSRLLTVHEIAQLTGRAESLVASLLEESELRGVVERVDDGYRLTVETERRFGRHLRAIGDEP